MYVLPMCPGGQRKKKNYQTKEPLRKITPRMGIALATMYSIRIRSDGFPQLLSLADDPEQGWEDKTI